MPPGRLTAKVWLLASMVSNGASDGYGKNQQPFHRAFIPNKGTRSQTRYVKNKKAQAMRASAFCYRLDMLMQTRSYYCWCGLWCLR